MAPKRRAAAAPRARAAKKKAFAANDEQLAALRAFKRIETEGAPLAAPQALCAAQRRT